MEEEKPVNLFSQREPKKSFGFGFNSSTSTGHTQNTFFKAKPTNTPHSFFNMAQNDNTDSSDYSSAEYRDQFARKMRTTSIKKQLTHKRDMQVKGDICQEALKEFEKNEDIETQYVDDVLYDYGPSEGEIAILMEEQEEQWMEDSCDNYNEKKPLSVFVKEQRENSNIGFGNFKKNSSGNGGFGRNFGNFGC